MLRPALLAVLLPASALAQGVAIEHKPIGCMVAGKHPVFNACFSPAGELARARVYFRAENTPHWYYVDMQSDAPCFKGTLPRPKKDIGALSYYVEATDRSFNPSRTDETPARVVGSQMECQKDVPVAPFVDKATVVVGSVPGAPVVPLGFATSGVAGAGGLSAAGAAGIVGGGAAAAGAVVASNNGSDSPTTTATPGTTTPSTTPTTTTPPPTTLPPPTAPPSTVPSVNLLPTLVAEVNPETGPSPLAARFNLCGSRDPEGDELRYTFDFESDGTIDASGGGAACRAEHTYTGEPGDRFTARVCVGDRVAGHEDVCGNLRVAIEGARAVCADGDESQPGVKWVEPNPFLDVAITADKQRVRVDVTDESTIVKVEFYAQAGGRGIAASAIPSSPFAVDTEAPWSATWNVPDDCGSWQLGAVATDACGFQGTSVISVFVGRTCSQAVGPQGAPALGWTSELAVPGATAQLVLNGEDAFFPGEGRRDGSARARRGANRLEGQLVGASGAAGTWRLELSGSSALRPGSIRVLAGEVVAKDATSVTFRLHGRAGERVAVEFESP